MNDLQHGALMDAIAAAKAKSAGPADEPEQLCCPKCKYCGPEEDFRSGPGAPDTRVAQGVTAAYGDEGEE